MTVLAIGAGNAILAWIAIVVALAGALAAVVLFNRLVRPVLEIERYAERIREAGDAIVRNTEALDELARTRRLATAVPGLAAEYLQRREAGGR